jgi:hypothetical protein
MLLPLLDKLEKIVLGLRDEAEDAHDCYMAHLIPTPTLAKNTHPVVTAAVIESHKQAARLETMAEVYAKISDQLTLIVEDEYKELNTMLVDMQENTNI